METVEFIQEFDLLDEFEELQRLRNVEKEALEDYCQDIAKLAKEKIGVLFQNEGRLHAAVVLSTLFLHSKDTIRIFAGNFNGEVSGISIWKKSLERAFEKNPRIVIDVILENMPEENSVGFTTLKNLRKQSPDRVTIRLLTEQAKTNTKVVPDFHFAVGDNNKFRIETNTATYKAVCNFDDAKTSNQLIDMFLMLKTNSQLIA